MNKYSKILLAVILLFAIFPAFNHTDAKESEDKLIKGTPNPEELSIDQINSKLKEIGFTDREINKLSEPTKENIVKYGGKKVQLSDQELEHFYTSNNGEKYEITKENEDEINKIKQQDLIEEAKVNNKSVMSIPADDLEVQSVSTMDVGDVGGKDPLSLNFFVTQTSSGNSNEYEYIVHFDWNWSDFPNFAFTDKAAMSWDNNYSGVQGSQEKYNIVTDHYASGPVIRSAPQLVSLSPEVYGITGEINLTSSGTQYGGFSQHIRVPKTSKGRTTTLLSSYVHAYSPFDIGMSIGPGSISVKDSALSDEWRIGLNVTVGE